MSDLAAALQIAIRVHAGQVDKQGQPHLLHVLRVVEAVSDEAKVVAALHDAFEDGEWGDDDASSVCEALAQNEVAALDLLTHVSGDAYAEYIARIATSAHEDDRRRAQRRERGVIDRALSAGQIAREVKIADIRDHLGRIPQPADCPWCHGRPFFSDASRDYRPCPHCAGEPQRWASLKVRYERALATLEGSQG